MMGIDRPFSKLSACILLIGGLGSLVVSGYMGHDIPTETYALLSASLGSASTFLFMADKKKDGGD